MKTYFAIVIAAALFSACVKENAVNKTAINQSENNAAIAAGNIPLNDLGTGKYNGYTGGLYPNGLNYPTGTYAADLLKICRGIVPVDTFGNPSKFGKIEMVSLGWSIGGQNMAVLKSKTSANLLTDPNLLLLSFSVGGGDARLNNILNPNDSYWNYVTTRITNSRTSYRQVQVVYLDTEDSSDVTTFPERPLLVKQDLEECFRILKLKFPNVKLVYLLSRTTTYGHQHIFNTEPCPYYFGWACKWAIEDQIKGAPGTAYKGANAVSPLITWGFYEWATSTPRITDGFSWSKTLMNSDGLHPNDAGHDTLMTHFQNFLLTDGFAKNWYAK